MIYANLMRWQSEYIRSQADNKCLAAGRRAGKTHVMKFDILVEALQNPGSCGCYITPSGALLHEIFRSLITDRHVKKRILRIEKQPMRQIFWRNGSRTQFIIFDNPDKILGFGYDKIWFDEIQKLVSSTGHDNFMRVIQPLLMEKQGKLTIAGQWRGKSCWWYKLFMEANKDNPDYRTWSIPSWEGYSFRDGKRNHPKIVYMKQTLSPQQFGQEVECIPTANANAAFASVDVEACTAGVFEEPRQGTTYCIGVDLGKTRDHASYVVMDIDRRHVVHVDERPLGERHELGAAAVARLALKYNNAEVIIDTTGGATGGKHDVDAYVKFYRERCPSMRSFKFTRYSKPTTVQNLSLALEQHLLTIPEEAVKLLDQVYAYEQKCDSWGNLFYSGPNGSHDDVCIALILAWEICKDAYGSTVMPHANVTPYA